MRRWNGWGESAVTHQIPRSAYSRLAQWVGESSPTGDVTLESVIHHIPDSRLAHHPMITDDRETRVRHARGQSVPDWVALRSGRIGRVPDGVVFPTSENQVSEILRWALDNQVVLIPYGGGTSVVGHINVISDQPTVTVNLSKLNQLLDIDEVSHLASFGAGISGPELEIHLQTRGFTLGHLPQSFELSTLGGWIATRSTGQQSCRYGKIERLFAGCNMISPIGPLTIKHSPASAAGPDLRELVLGSEGRMGIITKATMRISRIPQSESYRAYFFPDFASGVSAVKEMVQERIPASMLRLSSSDETMTTLALAGMDLLVALLGKALNLFGISEGKCMLITGVAGTDKQTRQSNSSIWRLARKHGGMITGKYIGDQWYKTRFTTPYLRNHLWELGYVIDTLETATSWRKLTQLIPAIETAIHDSVRPTGERVHVFTHVSHVYQDGASIYTSILFRAKPDPDETLNLWRRIKTAASESISASNATISHQHGIGVDHAPYLLAEKGELGVSAIQAAAELFDPRGIMNPGKLLTTEN